MKKLIRCAIAIAALAAIPAALATVPSATSRVDLVADGSTVAFPFTFKVYESSSVEVWVNGGRWTSGYAATLNVNQDTTPGGTVTFYSPPPNQAVVRIQRTIPYTQPMSLGSGTQFPAKTIEKAHDRSAMWAQQLWRDFVSSQVDAANAATVAVSYAVQAQTSAIAAAAAVNACATPGSSSLITATGSLTARTLAARSAESANVRDFGAIGDGASHPLSSRYPSLAAAKVDYPHATSLSQEIDWAATQAAVNAGADRIVFPGPATWVIGSSIDLFKKSNRTIDLGSGTLSYTGTDPMFLMTAAAGIIVRNGAITASGAAVATADAFVTGGSTTAQAAAYPSIPQEVEWSRQIRFEKLAVSNFATAFRLNNFSREIWITDSYVTGNAVAVRTTGKVANLYTKSSVLYSGNAGSQGVVVRGDASDPALWRYAEGLQFADDIVDVVGSAYDVKDVFLMRVTGGQIKSGAGAPGFALTKGVTGLTRDVKLSDALLQGPVNIGAGLATGFQFSTQISNCSFNSIPNTAVTIGDYTKGVEISNASFDSPSGTPVAIAVGASAVNIRLNALNIDTAGYTTGVTIDATSRSGVKGVFSGPWTPTLQFGGASTGITYQTQAGRYWWIDGIIFGVFQITLSSKGSSTGAATIAGLPFTALSQGTATVGRFSSNNTAFTPVLDISANGSAINVLTGAGGSAVTYNDTAFTNGSVLNGSFMYPVAQ